MQKTDANMCCLLLRRRRSRSAPTLRQAEVVAARPDHTSWLSKSVPELPAPIDSEWCLLCESKQCVRIIFGGNRANEQAIARASGWVGQASERARSLIHLPRSHPSARFAHPPHPLACSLTRPPPTRSLTCPTHPLANHDMPMRLHQSA